MSAVATIVVGTAAVGGIAQAYAGKKSADATKDASNNQIAEQHRQFDAIQELLAPFIEGGKASFGSQQALLGLSGPEAETKALSGLEQSPTFQALVAQGEEGILQNASATGGLRGGNIQEALARFRPEVLSQLLNDRFSKLSEITRLGQASATGEAAAGQNMANQVSASLGNIGSANAGKYMAYGNAVTGVTDTMGNLATLKLLGAF